MLKNIDPLLNAEVQGALRAIQAIGVIATGEGRFFIFTKGVIGPGAAA